MIRLTLPGAILACLAAVAVVAASAPAETATTKPTGVRPPARPRRARCCRRARRDPLRSRRRAHDGPDGRTGRHRSQDTDASGQPLQDRECDQALHGDRRSPARRRGQAPARRHDRPSPARARPERQRDQRPSAPQSHERPARLRRQPAVPQALPERRLRPLLVAAPARADGGLAEAAVRARDRLLVLEHELRRRPADRGEDHREASRRRVEAPDLPATAASTTRATRRGSQACRAPTRTATCCSESRLSPMSPASVPRSRRGAGGSSPPSATSPTSIGRSSLGDCSSRPRCGR